MSKTVTLHFNDAVPAMGERFVDAWHRAAAGDDVNETHVGFVDLQSMLSALTPRRMQLLRDLHAHPAKDVMALSRALGRDYKRVHPYVSALSEAGLISRDAQGMRVPFDVVRAEMKL